MVFRIIGQPGVFMRRWALEQAGGLDLAYHYLLDHHLWLRIAARSPIRYVDQAWAAARFHPAAKNLAQVAGFGQDAYRIAAWMQSDPGWQARYNAMPRQVQAGVHRINGWYYSEGGQYREALRAYGRGLAANPGVVLQDWKRILFTLAAAAGVNLKPAYAAWRRTDQEK